MYYCLVSGSELAALRAAVREQYSTFVYTSVGLLLVILTSSINILVLYLLVLLAIYLQIDIYPPFIYKFIPFLNWIK